MEKEVAVVDELQSVVTMLREQLATERQKSSELELQLNQAENKSEDLERQLTMVKKKARVNKNSMMELSNEMENLRLQNEPSASINSTITEELEFKIKKLTSENQVLLNEKSERVNVKFMELETKLQESERKNQSLTVLIE